jgi:monoamine oxidase
MATSQFHRRRFLQMAPAALLARAGYAAAKPTPKSIPGAKPDTPQVLIIGAGMAGASAAYHLNCFGIPAQILEAQSIPGGRILSSTLWPGATLDLGAAWNHFSTGPGNPLTPLIRDFGIGTVITDFSFNMYDNTNPAQAGKSVSDFGVLEIIADFVLMAAKVELQTLLLFAERKPDQPLGNTGQHRQSGAE